MSSHSSPQPSDERRGQRTTGDSDNGPVSGGGGDEQWVVVGEVTGVFGVRGELKVRPHTDFPDRFGMLSLIYLGEQRTPYHVQGAHPHKNAVLLKLADVDDPAAAEALRGAALAIPATALLPLERDRFYVHDVIGLRAHHVNGQQLGTVRDVIPGSGHDLFVIQDLRTGADVLVPAVKAFITSVDVEAGVVTIDPIPGLFDDQFDEAR